MRKDLIKNLSAVLPHGFGLLCAVLFPLLLCGCIHQYPDAVTAQKNVSIEVTLDREFIPLSVVAKSASDIVPAGYVPRFIVEARRAGETSPCIRKVVAVDASELLKAPDEAISLPVTLPLDAVPHGLSVWVDYVTADTPPADTHYNTEDLRSVFHIPPYHNDYIRREAFFGNLSVDLSSGSETDIKVRIALKRPLAHYRVVATDVQEFISKQHANGRPGAGEYEVTVDYQYFLVTHLNAVTGEPINSGSGFGYTRRIRLTGTMTECELAADYILADDNGSVVTLTVTVTDGEEVLLSRTANLEIPYRRGHITTVEGAFLSTKSGGDSSGGIDIGVDGDYEGEINIDATR